MSNIPYLWHLLVLLYLYNEHGETLVFEEEIFSKRNGSSFPCQVCIHGTPARNLHFRKSYCLMFLLFPIFG